MKSPGVGITAFFVCVPHAEYGKPEEGWYGLPKYCSKTQYTLLFVVGGEYTDK